MTDAQMWDVIMENCCPVCRASHSMLRGPRGGAAMNISCKKCDTKFWIAPHRVFGAKII